MGGPASRTGELPLGLLFDSIHYCLAAERAFKAHGLWCDVVPVPRHLSSDCGMAVEFRPSDSRLVREMCDGGSVRPKAAYRRTAGGHELVEAFGPRGGADGDAAKA